MGRGLTTGEIDLAESIYGRSITYTLVQVSVGGVLLGTGGTPKNTINVGRDIYNSDYSTASIDFKGFFIHELSHVRDYQLSGTNNVFRGAGVDYYYLDKIAKGNYNISTFSIEERAQLFQDIYLSSIGATQNQIKKNIWSGWITYKLPPLELLQRIAGPTRATPTERPDECFSSSTAIVTFPGISKHIANIQTGDTVLAFDAAADFAEARWFRPASPNYSATQQLNGLSWIWAGPILQLARNSPAPPATTSSMSLAISRQ